MAAFCDRFIGEVGSRAWSTLRRRLLALLALGATLGCWPPPPTIPLDALAAAALAWARAVPHQRSQLARVTAARAVCGRAPGLPDLYSHPSVRDFRAKATRAAPPPMQADFMQLSTVRAIVARLPPERGAFTATMWSSLARPSDWLGSPDIGRPPVLVRDVSVDVRRGVVLAILWRTKPDTEGVGRRIAFVLPPAPFRWLRHRLATARPTQPLFQVTYEQAKADVRPHQLRSFRRGSVRAALLAGVSVRAVQVLTGHKSRKTVLRYAGLMAPEDQRRAVAASKAVWGVPKRRRYRR